MPLLRHPAASLLGVVLLALSACAPMEPAKMAALPATVPGTSCSEHITQIGDPKALFAARSADEAWVLMAYDLDGSGRASNVQALQSSHPASLSKAMTNSYLRSSFQPGVVRQGCRDLLSLIRRHS